MTVLIAESRADVEAVLEVMKGTHPASLANRIAAVLMATGFGAVAAMMLIGTRDVVAYCLIPLFVGFSFFFLDEGFATLMADSTGFTRRSPFRRWHVAPHEVHSIEARIGSPTLIISTTGGKRRRTRVEGEAKRGLAKLYPELFGEPSPMGYSAKRRALIYGGAAGIAIAIACYAIWLNRR